MNRVRGNLYMGNRNISNSFNNIGNMNDNINTMTLDMASSSSSSVTINGKRLRECKNLKITIEYTDEKSVTEQEIIVTKDGELKVEVIGDVANLTVSNGSVTVTGNVTGNATTSNARVNVTGDVDGNVTTSNGKIEIGGNVGGNAKTSNGNIIAKVVQNS